MDIEYLDDHQETISTLARWSYEEWSYLHPEKTFAEVETQISAGCNRKQLPITLVALGEARPVGMISLKANDFKARQDLSPWLAGLYVDKLHRKQGVGSRLVVALEKLAVGLGVTRLYLVTDDAEAFYSKHGWTVLERTVSHWHSVTVMEKAFTRTASVAPDSGD
ncbi:MAG: N-acetyltransferase GCN5 [Nitrospirales bacterium]|nr:MAG: N-acetyltransferase GCN5 [Nitrospirales bacterium]